MGNDNFFATQNVNEVESKVMELVDICRRFNINIILHESFAAGDNLIIKRKTMKRNRSETMYGCWNIQA